VIWTHWAAMLLMGAGLFFIIVGLIGILRLPDFFTRLHAQSIGDTLGVTLMLGGLALYEGFTLTSAKIIAILFFIALANPTLTHALGRAALLSGHKPWLGDDK
jgi:multicomponent Na+:H+ antiporter subunit G